MRQPTPSERGTTEPTYVDDRELARRTSIARATWQKMRVKRQGPPVLKVGARCLYLWADVQAWMESHREPAVQP